MTHDPYDPSEEPVWRGKRLRDWFNYTREGISIAESMSDEEYEIYVSLFDGAIEQVYSIQVAEELSLDVIGLIQDGRLVLIPDGDLILADPVTINQMSELAQNYPDRDWPWFRNQW